MSRRQYQRWDMQQVRQHQLMVASVLILVATGMPLRYGQHPIAQQVAHVMGGPTVAGILHRVGGVMLIIAALWHGVYVLGRLRRRTMRWSTIPKWKDVTDAWHLALYLVGLRPAEPQYERYSFLEKFDYWAATGGSVVMALTGLVLWFPVLFAKVIGGLGIELSAAVHSLEALLAALFLLIGHVYHVHLAGGIRINWVWLRGTMTEAEMEHYHPLELRKLRAVEPAAGEPTASHEAEPAPAVGDAGGAGAGERLRPADPGVDGDPDAGADIAGDDSERPPDR